ncbi:MAG: hypothetical protein R3Y35_06780 [Clostridia bacterium]
MKFKKIISASLAVVMLLSMNAVSAFATEISTKEIPQQGTYIAETTMYRTGTSVQEIDKNNKIYGDSEVATYIELEVGSETVTINFYISEVFGGSDTYAPNQPLFRTFELVYSGQTYTVTPDMTVIYEKEFAIDGNEPTVKNAHKYSVTLPVEALGQNFIEVNTMLNTSLADLFYSPYNTAELVILNFVSTQTQDKQFAEVTATVANRPDYTVTVPEDLSIGDLTLENGGETNFSITIDSGSNTVEVSANETGRLTMGLNEITYTNDFGTQTSTGAKTLSGTIAVDAKELWEAPAGEYTGVMTFSFSSVS